MSEQSLGIAAANSEMLGENSASQEGKKNPKPKPVS